MLRNVQCLYLFYSSSSTPSAAVTKVHKSPELNEENLEIPKKPRLNSRHSATGSCGTMASDEVRSLK